MAKENTKVSLDYWWKNRNNPEMHPFRVLEEFLVDVNSIKVFVNGDEIGERFSVNRTNKLRKAVRRSFRKALPGIKIFPVLEEDGVLYYRLKINSRRIRREYTRPEQELIFGIYERFGI